MATNSESRITDEVVDQLLAGRDPATVFESGGLVDELKKRLAERILNGELDHHLSAAEEEEAGNHRNGYSSKTVLTDTGKLELSIPRDRHGRFDPVLIGKYRRRFAGFDGNTSRPLSIVEHRPGAQLAGDPLYRPALGCGFHHKNLD